MRLGLVGYGVGGRYFHAPFIEAAQGIDLAGVVTRSAERRAELAHDFPDVPVFASMTALLESGVDVVTITTPPDTRRELVLEAIRAGVAVVADKPFAPDADTGRELVRVAEHAGVPLAVFHNRRWDSDMRTLAAVMASGELGDPILLENRFDLDSPDTLEAGPGGGLLRDLGSHLVDQVLWLLGPVTSVHATLDWIELPAGRTDAAFSIELRHTSGVRSRVSSTKLCRLPDRELRLYARDGSYVAHSTDVQAQASFAGGRPAALGDAWGFEPEPAWGTLYGPRGERRIPSVPGRYQDYYTQLAAALRGEAVLPVTGREAVQTLEVLDAARASSLAGQVVVLAGESD